MRGLPRAAKGWGRAGIAKLLFGHGDERGDRAGGECVGLPPREGLYRVERGGVANAGAGDEDGAGTDAEEHEGEARHAVAALRRARNSP